jgi:hypothetical protein
MATVSALLAQWLERWSYEPEVMGSNPIRGNSLGMNIAYFDFFLQILKLVLFIH